MKNLLNLLITLSMLTAMEPASAETIIRAQAVRPLPGSLNTVLMFNSNSPEVVQTAGILLSTYPPPANTQGTAHLNLAFTGRFDIFAHHIAKASSASDLKTLYLGIILNNPSSSPVRVKILNAASYDSQPDAPFIPLPSMIDNAAGAVFAGPGDRVMNDLLRGLRQNLWPEMMVIPPKQDRMLVSLPIPVKGLTPPLNGRSLMAKLESDGPVYVASLAAFAHSEPDGSDNAPTLGQWQQLLRRGILAGPREKPASRPGAGKPIAYGRVAGVSVGDCWEGTLGVGTGDSVGLTIPDPGQTLSYVLSSIEGGTFATGQIQSAPLLVRYPDTAFRAHGNYGVNYALNLPLYNDSRDDEQVQVLLETPLKDDRSSSSLTFTQPPAAQVFFRGTLRISYSDARRTFQTKYIHLVEHRGEAGSPLVTINLHPKEVRVIHIDCLYPPDATPPQVLTVRTMPEEPHKVNSNMSEPRQ